MRNKEDVFYVKTKDSTVFAIYDLTISDDCDKISFGYNFIDDNPLDKSQYEEEVYKLVEYMITKAIKLEVANAEKRLNT